MDGFGERVKLARKSKGYTQSRLANLIGISTSSVGQFEVGKNKPTVENLIKISEACDRSIQWLITGSDSKSINGKNKKLGSFDDPGLELEKLMDENEQLKQQVRALTRAINLMPEYTGKDEVIDQQAGECQDRPPILHQPDTMTKQLDEAA